MTYKVAVFSHTENAYARKQKGLQALGLSPGQVLWCNSQTTDRLSFLNRLPGEWIFFIDSDCLPTAKTLKTVEELIRRSKKNYVGVGCYVNPEEATFFQRGHNFIANAWLEQSFFCEQEPLLLGGVFLVRAEHPVSNDEGAVFWGAEDKSLAYDLKSAGFEFEYCTGLEVVHDTSRSFRHFVKRAAMHGVNEVKYVGKNRNPLSYRFWIRKIGFANLSLLPLILLHFCIQKAAVLVQKARRPSSKDRSGRIQETPD